jgi:exopolysaccharide biosynthesis polyprenyl glycosylphosphotransferase
MSISDPEVEVGEPSGAGTAVRDVDHLPTAPGPAASPSLGNPEQSAAPYRTMTDKELTLVQICCDFVCTCVALPVSLVLLTQLSTVPVNAARHLSTNMQIDSLFPVAVVIALAMGGVYRVTHCRLQPSAFLEMREIAFGVGGGCVFALALGSLFHVLFGTAEPYATQLVMAVIVTIGAITLGRVILRYFLRTLTTTRVLVVGAGTAADRIVLSVRQDPGMTLVGRIVEDTWARGGRGVGRGSGGGTDSLGSVAELPELCRRLDVHRVLVATRDEFSVEAMDVYRQLQDFVHIAMVPRYYELISWRSRLTDLSGMPFLELAQPHLSPWDTCMKRAFDLCISSAVLLLTSPLLLIVAVGVKLSSPGPVFFRQIRIGRDTEPFMVTKFRSMTTATEDRPPDPAQESDLVDPDRPLHEVRHKDVEAVRVTRFGAFLRRTSIDEIPQFINVFKGDMSVVGPRPFIPSESNVEGWATRRFEVRPGITGLWQVSGRNDLTRNDLVQLDYLYVASWSLWWDLKIMFETPKTMARGVGAY